MWFRRKKVNPLRLEDYYESHPDLRLIVRMLLSLQATQEQHTRSIREIRGEVDLLNGNSNSTTGGTLTRDIGELDRRLVKVEAADTRATLLREAREAANG